MRIERKTEPASNGDADLSVELGDTVSLSIFHIGMEVNSLSNCF